MLIANTQSIVITIKDTTREFIVLVLKRPFRDAQKYSHMTMRYRIYLNYFIIIIITLLVLLLLHYYYYYYYYW